MLRACGPKLKCAIVKQLLLAVRQPLLLTRQSEELVWLLVWPLAVRPRLRSFRCKTAGGLRGSLVIVERCEADGFVRKGSSSDAGLRVLLLNVHFEVALCLAEGLELLLAVGLVILSWLLAVVVLYIEL